MHAKPIQLFATLVVCCLISSIGKTWCFTVLATATIIYLFDLDERESKRSTHEYAKKD
jgi:hypothetical protein